MKFLIQTVNREITIDFCFELLRSIEFLKWKNQEVEYKTLELDELANEVLSHPLVYNDWVPVGTLEFVEEYIKCYASPAKVMKPLNVPSVFVGRAESEYVLQGKVDDIYEKLQEKDLDVDPIYVKSMKNIKSSINGRYSNALALLDLQLDSDEEIQVRKELNILSEWRCFLYSNELVGCQWYSGDFLEFPKRSGVRALTDMWIGTRGHTEYGLTGTLDIAVTLDFNREGSSVSLVVLEAHEFYSCGLYGFSDYNKLPNMLNRAWNEVRFRMRN